MRETMPLSAAIRLGAMLKPQAFNQWDYDGSCALAAACEAVGIARVGMLKLINGPAMRAMWPVLKHRISDDGLTVQDHIWRLNDGMQWSREQIADWLEGIESQQPTAPPVEVACE